ncbi:histidine kinase [Roseimaritima sediminicola]|uniref:histidine kinase n=1 Tax=Roseimaritima sediminicola TaxID=2662066 RepID=UPI00129826AD|nr:histidine kinase [Roseimaritima sediminicola]
MNEQAVWFLSGDLMFASRVQAAANDAGFAFRLLGNLPDEDDGQPPSWIILDLASRARLLPDVVAAGKPRYPDARWIAYGPHVQVDSLNAARTAGIETVLTRGQFNAALNTLFSGE